MKAELILHKPKVTVRHADIGAMEVLLDDFVYVRINAALCDGSDQ